MGIESYKELYDLSNRLLEEEHGRFNRVSQKATSYLSVITLLLGIATIFGKEVIANSIPPDSLLGWLLLGFAVTIFISLAITWYVIFRAYRFEGLLTRPMNSLIDFYDDNRLIDIYFAMAKANSKARDENIGKTNQKARLLEQGHKMILVTAVLTSMFALLYFASFWAPKRARLDTKAISSTEGMSGAASLRMGTNSNGTSPRITGFTKVSGATNTP